jgi:hypothetical protein
LHIQQRTPKLDKLLVVPRSDELKLVFGFALQVCEDGLAILDVV